MMMGLYNKQYTACFFWNVYDGATGSVIGPNLIWGRRSFENWSTGDISCFFLGGGGEHYRRILGWVVLVCRIVQPIFLLLYELVFDPAFSHK